MRHYVRVPREIILNKGLGDKRVIVYAAAALEETSICKRLTQYSGYFSGSADGGIKERFQELLDVYVAKGYFSVKCRKLVHSAPSDNFGIIWRKEFEQITRKEKPKRGNPARELLVLAYIRASYIRHNGASPFYSDLITRISEKIGIPPRAVTVATRKLQELQIIYNEELPRYKRDGQWHSNVHLYVDMKVDGKYWTSWRESAAKISNIIAAQQISKGEHNEFWN